MKIALLIRVYDRIEDLKYNLQIIRSTWTDNQYYIIVVSNGKNKGYLLPQESIPMIDKLVVLEENAGHRKGNSQLLMEGAKYIPDDCPFTIILEADTWMYTDRIATKYTKLLDQSEKNVWASADWYDKDYALATDYAIIKTAYLKQNPFLFNFDIYPESYIANYLRDTGAGFIWITENMPVHIPSYVRIGYPYVPNIKEKRFYVFPKSKTVTHHIEYLKGNMEQKKRYFNIVADFDYFPEIKVKNKNYQRFKMQFWIGLSKCFIKKSWFKKKTYRSIPDTL